MPRKLKRSGRGRGRGRKSTSPGDLSDSDIESKHLRLSPDQVTETGDDKDNNVSDDYDEVPLDSASSDSGFRRTSMRKCKEQTLQKRQEDIKKRAEDRFSGTDVGDALSFSSDDEGEQLDDSDLDPVWTPADKVETSKSPATYGEESKRRGARGNKAQKTIVSPEQEPKPMPMPVVSETSTINIVDTPVNIIEEKITAEKKTKTQTSYKYTMSNHVIEGQFKPGNFVLAIEDKDKSNPSIWRIEGKSLLQRFEPFNDDGRLLYRNASSYSAWNAAARYKYIAINVLLVSHNRNSSIVENLGPISEEEQEALKEQNANHGQQLWIYTYPGSSENSSGSNGNQASAGGTTHPQQENFEVFLQTLISQVLDPNFIIEITKENDEYFLSRMKGIEDITEDKKNKIFRRNLPRDLQKILEIFPNISILPNKDNEDALCEVCSENKAQHITQCHGQPYDSVSLGWVKLPAEEQSLWDYKPPVCATCAPGVVLYSRLHHHKYNFFMKCKKKVDDVRNSKRNEESHMLLEECLQDTIWVNQMFHEIKELWNTSDDKQR